EANPLPPGRGSIVGPAITEGKKGQGSDGPADPSYKMIEQAKKGGIRTGLGVPLLREGTPIGVIILQRKAVWPFTEKQIELVATFADQAVIAIENVRLFDAVQQRTRDLTESLEQQTATSDVLRVISSSPGELEPVFQAMLANATCICEAELGMLWRAEGAGFRAVSLHGVPPDLAGTRRDQAFHFDPKTPLGRLAKTKQLVHVADARSETAYIEGLQPFKEFVDKFDARTLLLVPMLKDDALVGVIAIYRKEVRPFTDKQIELVQNFGAQAVIAIENTRLLNELRQSLDQQTATSEVLSVISRSPGDLAPVFESILGNAVRICEAKFGGLFLSEGPGFRSVAQQGPLFDWWQKDPVLDVQRHPGLPLSRVATTRAVVHMADLAVEAAAYPDDSRFAAPVQTAGPRTLLGVPMLKKDELVGAIII